MTSTTGLTLTVLSATEIKIDWLYISFSSDTFIQQSSDGGENWATIPMTVPEGTNTFTRSALTTATKYWFRIRKTDWICYSEVVSATTL